MRPPKTVNQRICVSPVKKKLDIPPPLLAKTTKSPEPSMRNSTCCWPARALLVVASVLALTTSASAVFVTWDLNPKGLEQDTGVSSITYDKFPEYTFSASAWTVNSSGDTPLGLYLKNQGFDETGLGIVGPADHELQGSGGAPFQYIQFDLGALLSTGKVIGGALQLGSVQSDSNDTFTLYGSKTLGQLGTQIAGTFDSKSDLIFVNIPDWGTYRYISIGALSGDVLPVAFQANCIPEMSALYPILGLLVAISFTHVLRRQRAMKLRARN